MVALLKSTTGTMNFCLKELRHDILSLLWRLNYGLSIAKPKNNGFLRKKNTKGVILEQKGTRMAEDGKDWNGLEMTTLKSLAIFSNCMNGDIAPLNVLIYSETNSTGGHPTFSLPITRQVQNKRISVF